ncbi:MAG: IS200/IS605 family transposase [Acidobacteriota bacterium]|nr:IS200/IS605 family transposase [Acidobacteriota bacterium]
MPTSYVQVWLHIVFSTKHRNGYLSDPAIRKEMHRFLGGMVRHLGATPRIVNGVEDHVHILCGMSKTMTLAAFVKEMKRTSSIWVKDRFPSLADFSWQQGYGAFSVSRSAVERVHRYIADQERHHRHQGFQDEFIQFLKKHEIRHKEASLWD